jgi:thiosulfate/3-mercaptopyruvate sulfurtransferase
MADTYAKPDALVDTEWVAQHLNDPKVRVVESDEDVLLYETGHIPNSIRIDWHTELNDQVRRDYLDKEHFEQLMRDKGIDNDTTVVFYGDKNNWWACYAFWVFQLFGHDKAKIMNGGRKKWIEENRDLTREVPTLTPSNYHAKDRDDHHIRAFRDEVRDLIDKEGKALKGGKALVDVRSPGEYSGELLHMADYPQEGAMRGGHIPGARSIPWARSVRDDGTFKPIEELRELYETQGITKDKDVVAYCRIGERSSHTWFVLTYLLGYDHVRNYDGSWTEWGNLVGAPIER